MLQAVLKSTEKSSQRPHTSCQCPQMPQRSQTGSYRVCKRFILLHGSELPPCLHPTNTKQHNINKPTINPISTNNKFRAGPQYYSSSKITVLPAKTVGTPKFCHFLNSFLHIISKPLRKHKFFLHKQNQVQYSGSVDRSHYILCQKAKNRSLATYYYKIRYS